ncbi:MAG TPA: sigma-70 family RNA polymerase sigma factor [Isosphaeraceae bacterium]|nr:sigma-70 family RNA polymerase sigma factor [Isosphaeraceae bacterium]
MDDESRLVRAMARRDRSAWDAMYDRHVGDVFAVIYHLVGGNRQTAEDLNQEVWLLAIEQFDRFDDKRGDFRDWLLGIARHRVFRHYRRATVQTVEGRPDPLSDDLPPPELLEGRERAEVVRAALVCLHDGSRNMLLAKYAEGLSVAEIAAQSGRSAKAVESLLSRARRQLRILLEPYFSHTTGGQRHAATDARTT